METSENLYTLRDQAFPLHIGLYEHETRVSEHMHDFIEFVYVESGLAMHRCGEASSLMLPGDLFFILPYVHHSYWKSNNNKVYNCNFYPAVFGADLEALAQLPHLTSVLQPQGYGMPAKLHLHAQHRQEISALFRMLAEETQKCRSGWQLRAKILLTDILIRISRIWERCIYSTSHPDAEVSANAHNVLRAMELCGEKRLRVEDMARAAGYSTEHFSRIFKKLTGLPPSTYINSTKIAAATELLTRTTQSVTQIALAAGFDDINYFSRIFKKETGFTPKGFRDRSYKASQII